MNKYILILLFLIAIIILLPVVNSQSNNPAYLKYNVTILKETKTTFYNSSFILNYNETFSTAAINSTTFNNTINIKGNISIVNTLFKLTFYKNFNLSLNYKSKSSLVNELTSFNITNFINFTFSHFNLLKLGNLSYYNNFTYSPNGTVNVSFQNNMYSMKSYIFKVDISFKLRIYSLLYNLSKLENGKILTFSNGLLYLFISNASSYFNTKLETTNLKFNYSKYYIDEIKIQLVSTNIFLPKTSLDYATYLVTYSLIAGIIVGSIVVMRKFYH